MKIKPYSGGKIDLFI